MEKTLQSQITEIKFRVVSILTYQKERVSINELSLLQKLYDLLDEILLDKIHHPRYTVEEYVDSTLLEYGMILGASRNSEVKRLGKLIGKGLEW